MDQQLHHFIAHVMFIPVSRLVPMPPAAGPAPCEDAAVSAASLAQLRKLLGSGGLGLESSLVEELVRGEAQDARDLRLTVEGATDSAEADAALEVGEMQSARDVPGEALERGSCVSPCRKNVRKFLLRDCIRKQIQL